jgi:hypothetical protein
MSFCRITKGAVEGMRELRRPSSIGPSLDQSSNPAALLSESDKFIQEEGLADTAEPVKDTAAIAATHLTAFQK